MANTHFFRIAELVSRLEQVANSERFDQVTRQVHALYEKMHERNPDAIVSANDLRKTFSTFAGMNKESNFRSYFEDVFVQESNTQPKQDGAGAFDVNRTFGDDNRVLASTINTDPTGENEIRTSSFEKVRKIVSAALSTPEYKYSGFVRVASLGNSGFANWNVSVNTGKGHATIKVPVSIVDGYAYIPDKFFTASGNAMPLTKEALLSYVKSYTAPERAVAHAKSGLTALGSRAMLVESQMTSQYDEDARESSSINLNYTIPINEDIRQEIVGVEQKIQEAIEKAKAEVESTLAKGGTPTEILSVSLNINYAGSLPVEEECGPAASDGSVSSTTEIMPIEMQLSPRENERAVGPTTIEFVEAPPFNGIIAFNIKRKNSISPRVATVPVEVSKNGAIAGSFIGSDGKSTQLTYANLVEYLDQDSVKHEDSEDAFADAFLASDGTLSQLKTAMLESIEDNNLDRANFCLSTIASRFDREAAKLATSEYFNHIREVKQARLGIVPKKANQVGQIQTEQNSLDIHLM